VGELNKTGQAKGACLVTHTLLGQENANLLILNSATLRTQKLL
jgi:hypothetical protein